MRFEGGTRNLRWRQTAKKVEVEGGLVLSYAVDSASRRRNIPHCRRLFPKSLAMRRMGDVPYIRQCDQLSPAGASIYDYTRCSTPEREYVTHNAAPSPPPLPSTGACVRAGPRAVVDEIGQRPVETILRGGLSGREKAGRKARGNAMPRTQSNMSRNPTCRG